MSSSRRRLSPWWGVLLGVVGVGGVSAAWAAARAAEANARRAGRPTSEWTEADQRVEDGLAELAEDGGLVTKGIAATIGRVWRTVTRTLRSK